ncbi:arylesterase [Fodinibius saliphilus]|uniref:arylesterase n=1 Tax=Fodinibius saliphilus TaxID=1920650 RepID=UPI001108AE0F|nr:arylesterase [Fodinibius saliphilus]
MRRFLLVFVILLLFPLLLAAQDSEQRILFFGDSITAGYGINTKKAFPALIQQRIDSLGWNFQAVNAGLSGETSAGGVRRVDWMLRQPVSVFVLELGGNDGLRGIDLDATKKNLQKIIDKVEQQYPKAEIIITGMQVPPNLGPEYTEKFKEMYPELARKNDIILLPFLLKGVAGDPELNQADGIHPTAKGHEIIAETVWDTLKPILKKKRKEETYSK